MTFPAFVILPRKWCSVIDMITYEAIAGQHRETFSLQNVFRRPEAWEPAFSANLFCFIILLSTISVEELFKQVLDIIFINQRSLHQLLQSVIA